jgi:hypothetical protein
LQSLRNDSADPKPLKWRPRWPGAVVRVRGAGRAVASLAGTAVRIGRDGVLRDGVLGD